MKINVVKHRCIGAGACVFAAPEAFAQDEQGIVRVLHVHPPAEMQDAVRAAADACPAAVIELESDDD